MARRQTRGNPFAGGAATPPVETAPDPLAGLGGDEVDPLAGFGMEDTVPADGLDALTKELGAGTIAPSGDALTEIHQQVTLIAGILGQLATTADLKALHDYVSGRVQLQESNHSAYLIALDKTYKETLKLQQAITDLPNALSKWFDESLTKFNESLTKFNAGDGVATNGVVPAATVSAAVQESTTPVPDALTPSQQVIIDTLLPILREKKKAQAAFKLQYESKGPMVWKALADVLAGKSIKATVEEVEAAFKAAKRLQGSDDISLA